MTLPNFFGEAPAVQVSSGKATIKVDLSMVGRVEQVLAQQGLAAEAIQFDGNSVKARFASTDLQIKARDAIDHALNTDRADPGHVVALNLLPRTPAWLQSLHAAPMYLGLDLRGGVHFMLQVDMPGALVKRAEAMAGDVRTALREKNLRAIVRREGQALDIRLRDAESLNAASQLLKTQFNDWVFTESAAEGEFRLTARLKPEGARAIQEQALKQNINTLNNRINELGVAEPVIQQQRRLAAREHLGCDRPHHEPGEAPMPVRAHHQQIEPAGRGLARDQFAGRADPRQVARFDSVAGEKAADRLEDAFGFVFVIALGGRLVERDHRTAWQGRHHRQHRVVVAVAEEIVVCREIREHALRVAAAVDGEEDLHGGSPWLNGSMTSTVSRHERTSG